MKTKIRMINTENREDILAWEDFLLRANDGNILQSTLMANVFMRAGFDCNLIVAKRNKEIVGGALSTVWPGRKFRLMTRFSTFKTTYGPIAIRKEKGMLAEILKELDRSIARNKPMQHIIITKYHWLDEASKTLGYDLNPRIVGCTFLIDLRKSEEDLWKALRKRSCRKRISRAEKNGVEAREDSTQNAPRLMHELHLKTVERLGIPANPLSFFNAIWECLSKRKHAIFFFAYYQGKPIAGLSVLTYKNTIYSYSSASLEQGLELNANRLLKWNAIRWGKEQGYEFCDLLFAPNGNEPNNPMDGLYVFKKSFGGIEIPIRYYQKKFSPIKLGLWNNMILPTYDLLTKTTSISQLVFR